MSQRSAMEVAETQGLYDSYCAQLADREEEVAGWNPQAEPIDDYLDRVEFRLVERRKEAKAEADKYRREAVELVNALEEIHEALRKGVPAAAELLAYQAISKWGRG